MSYALAYWILMLLWLVCGGLVIWQPPQAGRWPVIGWSILVFVLFLLIGLRIFGKPLHG